MTVNQFLDNWYCFRIKGFDNLEYPWSLQREAEGIAVRAVGIGDRAWRYQVGTDLLILPLKCNQCSAHTQVLDACQLKE